MTDEALFGEDYLFFYAEDASEVSILRDADVILRMLDLLCVPRTSSALIS